MTDEPAWLLVEPHRERLVRIARRRTGSNEDAEDIASEALIRVATFPALDHERVGEMLTSVTVRLCVDLARHRAVERSAAPRLHEVPSDPMAALMDAFEARWLAEVPLTKVERTLLLARVHGLYPSEVAAGLGLTVDSAKMALRRARGKIVHAWKATLGVIGALRLRRLLPASGAVAVAMAGLVVMMLAPPVREQREASVRPVTETLRSAAPSYVKSSTSRLAPVPTAHASAPPSPSPSPSVVTVRVPGVRGKGFGSDGSRLIIDLSEHPVARVVRCVKNGVEVDPASASLTCRE